MGTGQGTDRWRSLYAGGSPPTETGIGAATVRRQRRRRRRAWVATAVLLAITGLVAYILVPRWWFSPTAYVDHLGYGPYEGEMPADLHAQLAKAVPGLVSFVEKERGLSFQAPPTVVFLPDQLFSRELSSHVAFQQRHYVGGATYDALGWAHRGDTFDRFTLDLHGNDVVSLYGDWDGTIYLRGHALTPLAKAQLVGLLTQSLDDQTFNLAAVYGPDAEQDERTAYDALVAGDDAYVQRAYLAGRPLAERCAIAPVLHLPVDRRACTVAASKDQPVTDPITAEIRFPQEFGLRFVTLLRSQAGTKALDAAFRHPPRSTADVMSPPHYRLDKAFQVVPAPPHEGELVDFGTLGAYTLALALADGQPGKVDAGNAVEGWRGDSFSTYRKGSGGPTCVSDTAVFDSQAQADHYAARARSSGATTHEGPGARAVSIRICH
ncbi:MAG: hypothetical protein ACJ74O_10145 [Frankiaceae bacterium]